MSSQPNYLVAAVSFSSFLKKTISLLLKTTILLNDIFKNIRRIYNIFFPRNLKRKMISAKNWLNSLKLMF